MRFLHLYNNQLTSIPPEMGRLVKLEELNLSYNQLTSIPPEITGMVKLEYLNLNNNQLTSIPPEIGQLVNLTDLLLKDNLLTSIPLEIGGMPSLRLFSVENNPIRRVKRKREDQDPTPQQCCVCYLECPLVSLIYCPHACCESCTEKLTTCPMCRAEWEE
jgi:Leucine-rich repeat (LRR) protein